MYNIYIGILSFCGILVADEICHMSCDCVTFYLDWHYATGTMPLCLGGIFRVDLMIPIVDFCSQFLVYVRNLLSFVCSNPFPCPRHRIVKISSVNQFQISFQCLVVCHM